jgi:hypothetical protein
VRRRLPAGARTPGATRCAGAPPTQRPDPYASGRVARAPYGAAARAATPPWGARADAVARWCLSKRPLAPATLALLGPDALAAWVGRTPGDTLGALLRAALGAGEGGLVALYDALADPASPGSRALLARVLGAPFLLVTVRVRQGALVGADARACSDEREALGLLRRSAPTSPGAARSPAAPSSAAGRRRAGGPAPRRRRGRCWPSSSPTWATATPCSPCRSSTWTPAPTSSRRPRRPRRRRAPRPRRRPPAWPGFVGGAAAGPPSWRRSTHGPRRGPGPDHGRRPRVGHETANDAGGEAADDETDGRRDGDDDEQPTTAPGERATTPTPRRSCARGLDGALLPPGRADAAARVPEREPLPHRRRRERRRPAPAERARRRGRAAGERDRGHRRRRRRDGGRRDAVAGPTPRSRSCAP